MKCTNCGTELPDGSAFCTNCGASLAGGAPQSAGQTANTGVPQMQNYATPDSTDHTAEFSAKDISDNKVMAMVPYLLGTLGIILALLASKESPYTSFHVRQALKITVVNTLIAIISLVLFWTIIIPILAGICIAVLFVIKVICFFSVCSGKAKEPPIISSLKFLK